MTIGAGKYGDLVPGDTIEVHDVHTTAQVTPIVYAGSTTGPSYSEKGSPFQVTWRVRPQVAKVSIRSVDAWLKDNIFNEASAHGVRKLVTNPDLLSPIR